MVAYQALLLVATLLVGLGFWSAFAGLVETTARAASAVVGLLLVEQLFRSSTEHERWSMKFVCLALAGLFVFDFYLYSDAMLFHTVNPEILAARGFVNALLIPLFLVSLNRNLEWTRGIAVSRRILFHSTALIGSAGYLLLMAAAGYYLRYFGGQWGGVLQMAFLFAAALLLVVVLFSGAVRSKLRVFISKHFYQYSYDYREEWIRFTRVLSAAGPGLGERVIEAVAQLVESGAGTLFVARHAGQFDVDAQWNSSLICPAVQASSELCRFLEQKQWIVDLQDYRNAPEKYEDIEIEPWLLKNPAAWLLIPLILQGRLFGFILLERSRSKIELNWEILDVLKIAASQAVSYLAQQQSADGLMIARQFESFNRMSTFIVHDLKNMVAQLSLMMVNAEKHQDNPEFREDMLERVLGHLIQNAIEATPRQGLITVRLRLHQGTVELEIADSGAGMSEEFIRDKLFSPFVSTKVAGMGIGVFETREYIEQLGGRLEVSSQLNKGSCFKISLPVNNNEDYAMAHRTSVNREVPG